MKFFDSVEGIGLAMHSFRRIRHFGRFRLHKTWPMNFDNQNEEFALLVLKLLLANNQNRNE